MFILVYTITSKENITILKRSQCEPDSFVTMALNKKKKEGIDIVSNVSMIITWPVFVSFHCLTKVYF